MLPFTEARWSPSRRFFSLPSLPFFHLIGIAFNDHSSLRIAICKTPFLFYEGQAWLSSATSAFNAPFDWIMKISLGKHPMLSCSLLTPQRISIFPPPFGRHALFLLITWRSSSFFPSPFVVKISTFKSFARKGSFHTAFSTRSLFCEHLRSFRLLLLPPPFNSFSF